MNNYVATTKSSGVLSTVRIDVLCDHLTQQQIEDLAKSEIQRNFQETLRDLQETDQKTGSKNIATINSKKVWRFKVGSKADPLMKADETALLAELKRRGYKIEGLEKAEDETEAAEPDKGETM